MATWDDVARVCLALPGTSEATSASGRRRWLVRGRTLLRERPLHRTDLDELGDAAPEGPVLVAYVPDEGAKLYAARESQSSADIQIAVIQAIKAVHPIHGQLESIAEPRATAHAKPSHHASSFGGQQRRKARGLREVEDQRRLNANAELLRRCTARAD